MEIRNCDHTTLEGVKTCFQRVEKGCIGNVSVNKKYRRVLSSHGMTVLF